MDKTTSAAADLYTEASNSMLVQRCSYSPGIAFYSIFPYYLYLTNFFRATWAPGGGEGQLADMGLGLFLSLHCGYCQQGSIHA